MTLGQLHTAWEAGEHRAVREWKSARGPVDAARLTASRLGWQWPQPWELIDDLGVTLHLAEISPRMLRKLGEAAARRQLERQVSASLQRQGWRAERGPVTAAAVQRVLAGKKLTEVEKGSLRAVVCSAVWPAARLAAAGYATSAQCTRCGKAKDTIFHRVWECESTADLRVGHDQLVKEAKEQGESHPTFGLGGLMVNPSEHKPGPWAGSMQLGHAAGTEQKRCFQAAGGPIYVDGSCVPHAIPELARAAWAAVQLDEQGKLVASASGPVPAGWPQTSQAAEHLAMVHAVRNADPDCTIVGDCQNVVETARAGPCPHRWRQLLYGGCWKTAWRSPAAKALLSFNKVKSHQAWEAMPEGPQRDAARGNDAADFWAKHALTQHPRWSRDEEREVQLEWDRALAAAELTAKAVTRWPRAQRAPRLRREQQAAEARQRAQQRQQQRQAARAAKHEEHLRRHATHSWDTWKGVTRCVVCLQQRKAADLAPCPEAPPKLLQLGHQAREYGHRLWAAAAVAASGREATPVAFCAECGGWAQGVSDSKLRDRCKPATRAGQEALSRIWRGLFPKSDVRWRGVRIEAAAPWTPPPPVATA